MAVPKKRTGASAQAKRRANWKASKPEVTTCSNCGATVLTHTVCTACGYYKGKAVSIKSADFVATEEVKEVKAVKAPKKTRKSTKKTKADEAVVDVKAEEVVTEEPKAEATEDVKETVSVENKEENSAE